MHAHTRTHAPGSARRHAIDTAAATLQVGADFNFAAMIQEYLTEEFARVVRFDLVLWGIAIIWMVFPEGTYGGFWMTGGFTLLSLAAGAKLAAAAMNLARHAYGLYYEAPPQRPPSAAPRELERSAGALMPGASVGSSTDGKTGEDSTVRALRACVCDAV